MENEDVTLNPGNAVFVEAEKEQDPFAPYVMPILDSPFRKGLLPYECFKYAHEWVANILTKLEPKQQVPVHNLFQLVYETKPVNPNLEVAIVTLQCSNRHLTYIDIDCTCEGATFGIFLSFDERRYDYYFDKGYKFEQSLNY